MLFQASGLLHVLSGYLCAAVWLHLHDSVSPRIHLPPLSSRHSASLLSYAPPASSLPADTVSA